MGRRDLLGQGSAGRHRHREGRLSETGDHPLDNVVWSALTSAHATLALGQGLARHYPRDIAPFSAIAEPSEAAHADLAASLPPDGEVRLFRAEEEPTPPGWQTLSARPIIQMIADAPADEAPSAGVVPLSRADSDEILALVALAKPGPFARRTPLLGSYVGLRDPQGRLIAMAGERFRLPGYTEISAICTHPRARGRGHGARLARHLMAAIRRRGETPVLHVYPDNPAAALYPRWGFRARRLLWVIQRRLTAG